MRLTLQQAASLFGKSPRQIHYMIRTGELSAVKEGAHWRVESADLPVPEDRRRAAREARQQQLRAAVEDALDAPDSPARRGYSFRDLRAAQVGLDLHPRLAAALGPEHAATQSLALALSHLARGCHRYRRDDKLLAYRDARDEASRCVSLLAIQGAPAAIAALETIEAELLPAVGGLIRRSERRERAA